LLPLRDVLLSEKVFHGFGINLLHGIYTKLYWVNLMCVHTGAIQFIHILHEVELEKSDLWYKILYKARDLDLTKILDGIHK
jgi:hypothetical protein